MQQLTVPEDVWACRQPGVPFVAAIVDGEIVASSAPMFPDSNLPGTSSIPPAWLVALRDARCETCVDEYGERVMQNCNNPRCHNGWLLHDVRVEDPDGEHDGYTEYRPVSCLVDVVPVNRACDVPALDSPMLVVFGDGWVIARFTYGELDPSQAFDLNPAHVDALAAACGKPPADWPGGYAVVLTEVGE